MKALTGKQEKLQSCPYVRPCPSVNDKGTPDATSILRHRLYTSPEAADAAAPRCRHCYFSHIIVHSSVSQ